MIDENSIPTRGTNIIKRIQKIRKYIFCANPKTSPFLSQNLAEHVSSVTLKIWVHCKFCIDILFYDIGVVR